MTAGPVNRALLESNFQNPGDVYSDLKTEGAFDVVADQIDDNWDYTTSLVANGTLTPYPSFLSRQAIINGNFDVWQRGTSFTNPANNTYTTDRFKQIWGPNGGVMPTSLIHQRQPLVGDELLPSFYYYRIAVSDAGSGFGASAFYSTSQLVENGTRYLGGAGKKVTISFFARSSITNKRIGVSVQQAYGTGGSPTATEALTTSGQIISLTTTFKKYTLTFATNTTAGKTYGTNNDDYLQFNLFHMWGTTTATNLLGGGTAESFIGAGNIDIAQVQVNAGDQALPFQPRSFADELQLCQRYYEKSYSYSDAPGTNTIIGSIAVTGVADNSGIADVIQPYKVPKRTNATCKFYTPTGTADTVSISVNGGAYTTFAALNGSSPFQSENITGIRKSSLTAGQSSVFSFHYTADAEL